MLIGDNRLQSLKRPILIILTQSPWDALHDLVPFVQFVQFVHGCSIVQMRPDRAKSLVMFTWYLDKFKNDASCNVSPNGWRWSASACVKKGGQ